MTTNSNRVMRLVLNIVGMSMSLDNFPIMMMGLHLTYTPLFIRPNNMSLINHQSLRGFLRNGVIGCIPRKKGSGINYQNQPRLIF